MSSHVVVGNQYRECRHHQRRCHARDDLGQDNRGGACAQGHDGHRRRKQGNGAPEYPARAVARGDLCADQDEHGDDETVGDDGGRHARCRGVEAGGDALDRHLHGRDVEYQQGLRHRDDDHRQPQGARRRLDVDSCIHGCRHGVGCSTASRGGLPSLGASPGT